MIMALVFNGEVGFPTGSLKQVDHRSEIHLQVFLQSFAPSFVGFQRSRGQICWKNRPKLKKVGPEAAIPGDAPVEQEEDLEELQLGEST